ncbi:MAG TPA: DUF4238 domain-containing protein [Burkholderiaceae bacterium]|jgi:hypothetical protein|uniref:DUF4238 domain-containing protein n=1 Tax=Tepidiphilus succinatimandens TaxID=224436 RepID=UPI00112F15D8|nr:DUF4238 domain-containing protein [Tepidiphilus succinatimandens]HWP18767.1 DUF4238 domain-containing protein [Burkholderiaceae bacterium]
MESAGSTQGLGIAAAPKTGSGATRAPMLNGPKRQHFLPRFYLEGFCRDGLVAVYDRNNDEVRLQQPVNTAVIGHFYTLEDTEGRKRFELEAVLCEYEGKAKPAIAKLIACEGLSDQERSDLSIFIALAAMRTPDMVNSVQSLNGQMVAHSAKLLFRDVEKVYQDLRADKLEEGTSDEELREQAAFMVDMAQSEKFVVTTDEKWAVQMTMQMALGAAPYLAGRHWRVVHRERDKHSFVTTDSPVFLNTTAPRGPSPYGVGFGSPDAFISFPLDQSCVLQAWGDDGLLEHKGADGNYIRKANLALGARCQRFLVARDEALVSSLAQELGLAQKQWQPKLRLG